MLTCNELSAVFVIHCVRTNGTIRFALSRDVCWLVKDLVESFRQGDPSTHFDYIVALGDNYVVLAPSVQPCASLLASSVPPHSVGADVADWRRSFEDWRRSANAFGHTHRRSVGAGTWQSDEDLGCQAQVSANGVSERPTEVRILPWNAHHRIRFASRWHAIEELATLVQIVQSAINF